MKTSASRFRVLIRILLGYVLLTLTSCTVFQMRYNSWNDSVTRTPEGVLTHAQPSSKGQGDIAFLLVHGFGDGPHVWNALSEELASRQIHVRCMRLPGWNEPIEVKRTTTAADWEAAVREEWTQLRESYETVVVMAHSLGGCITVATTQGGGIEPDALVLYAPLMEVSNARSPILTTRQWYKLGSKILPQRMILESIFPDHAVRATPRPKTLRDPLSPVSLYHELYGEMDRMHQQEAKILCPVRLVVPEEDRVVDEATTLAWFERLDAPSKELHREENSGHVLPLELDPALETDRILQWLNAKGIMK